VGDIGGGLVAVYRHHACCGHRNLPGKLTQKLMINSIYLFDLSCSDLAGKDCSPSMVWAIMASDA
jgi:hypothetical protein